MGILDSLGIGKGTGSAYNKIHKIILNHYQNYQKYIATDLESYNKSQNAKQSPEFELFSLLGKDKNTLNLLNKYNLTITYLEELYNRIIEEGGGQDINGKFIPF